MQIVGVEVADCPGSGFASVLPRPIGRKVFMDLRRVDCLKP
jgi:hypothetical protein